MPNTSLNTSAVKKPKCSDGREALSQRGTREGMFQPEEVAYAEAGRQGKGRDKGREGERI